ncbi:putative DNA-directed RNA polymerase II subunit [Emiliania huxleyi virus 18]|nr:putative DNA-directed RNA polymerase II subunit [Emiliania huxleyi virus 18]
MSLLQADPTEGEVRRDSKRDRSHVLKTDEPVVVDSVFLSKTPEGHGYVKVRTRAVRIPMVGDKFSR